MRLGPSRHAAAAALVASLAGSTNPSSLVAEPGAPARGTVERLEMDAPSLGQSRRNVRVYLPPSYYRTMGAQRRYPVVFLLHGWPGSDGNWFSLAHANDTADSLAARGEIPEVILVCPNGNGRGLDNRSLYINSHDGAVRMEDYIVHDLVPWADSTFRTRGDPAHRAVIGLSDGGTAALDLAFRHRDVFGACGGHSGAYRLRKQFGMGAAIGPEPGASRLLDAHSPALYVDRIAAALKRTTIYFDCGLADESLEDNRAFHHRLEALGIAHTYREFPGTHTWEYWRSHLRESLIAVTAGMTAGVADSRADSAAPGRAAAVRIVQPGQSLQGSR